MRSKTTISITEARRKIFDIAEEVQKPGVYYTFTEKGRPKAVLMSAEEFDSLLETLEILGNPEVMKRIEQAEKEYKKGEYVTWEDLKSELGYPARAGFVFADKGKKKYSAKRKRK